jgi:WD40 repeat protein
VVRYSPDGNYWASGGFDGKIFLYDGKELNINKFIYKLLRGTVRYRYGRFEEPSFDVPVPVLSFEMESVCDVI